VPSAGTRWNDAVAYLTQHGPEARLAIRVAVAAVAAYVLAQFIGLTQGYWAVFTAVIVMQASIGGSVKATIDRLTGTLGGAIYGGAVALATVHEGPLAIGIGLAIAVLPLAYVAALDARFRVAPVTAVIVLISPFGQQASPVTFTIDRIVEIGLGGIVALVVSLLILPARAHGVLAEATGRLLRLFADFLELILAGATAPIDPGELRRLQIATRRTLNSLEPTADEARRERAMRLTDEPDPEPIVRTSMRLRNDLIILARAVMTPLPQPVAGRLATALRGVAAEGSGHLRALAAAFEMQSAPPSFEALDAALRAYHGEIATLRAEGAIRVLPGEAIGRVFALGFGLDQFRTNLGDLADRAGEFAHVPAAERQQRG
jgi:uncharacterized membrane protein YccC